MEAVYALGILAAVVGHGQAIAHGDALEHEDALAVDHLAGGPDLVPIKIDFDMTRLQRACERAGQSAAGRRDHVVERGRVRRELLG